MRKYSFSLPEFIRGCAPSSPPRSRNRFVWQQRALWPRSPACRCLSGIKTRRDLSRMQTIVAAAAPRQIGSLAAFTKTLGCGCKRSLELDYTGAIRRADVPPIADKNCAGVLGNGGRGRPDVGGSTVTVLREE